MKPSSGINRNQDFLSLKDRQVLFLILYNVLYVLYYLVRLPYGMASVD